MPELTPEQREAFHAALAKLEADRKAFEALPKDEQDRIRAEEDLAYRIKLGWFTGYKPTKPRKQYGTLVAA